MSDTRLPMNLALLQAAIEQRDEAREMLNQLREILRPAIEAARERSGLKENERPVPCFECGGEAVPSKSFNNHNYTCSGGCGRESATADDAQSITEQEKEALHLWNLPFESEDKALLRAGEVLGVE